MKNRKSHFLVGAATAAHQVEGNNINSDCWALEQASPSMFMEPSGAAVDHYSHYEEDIQLLAQAGLNAYRFSIEWARIEPEQGVWVQEEIEHYRKVLQCCRKNNIEPIVTLHHFSSPKWLITLGGWENPQTADLFAAYCERVVDELGGLMHYVCTINEANIGSQIAHMMSASEEDRNNVAQVGVSNPFADFQNVFAAAGAALGCDPANLNIFLFPHSVQGEEIIMDAHKKACAAIKAVCPELKVGITLSLHDFQPVNGGEERALREWEIEFSRYIPVIAQDDFLGVQCYTRTLIGPKGALPIPEGAECTQMGYEDYPMAITHVVRKAASQFKGNILITENGIATSDDARRTEFIREATEGIRGCIEEGIPVKGYFYWSLLDNFEWMAGYGKTFGLIEVDRKTQRRFPKPSLQFLGALKWPEVRCS